MEQKIDPLTNNEEAWVTTQLENAARLVGEYSPSDAGQPLTLAALDRAYAAWVTSGPSDGNQIDAIINAVGLAFGCFLVDQVGFKWVIATDQYGTDMAIYALPGTGDVLVYPANFVAKRWERRETNFLQRSFQQIALQVEQVKREHTGGSAGF